MEINDLYSLDIFLQGIFLLICLAIGLYLVFNDNLEKLNTSENIAEISTNIHKLVNRIFSVVSLKDVFKEPKEILKLLGVIPIVIISSFILGILGYGVADEWIDSKSKNHLFLKPLWISDLSLNNNDFNRIDLSKVKIDKFSHYKKRIRYKGFLEVFDPPNRKINPRNIEQLYYQAKHEILKDEQYYDYVRKSQSIVEYSRTFALGFFILFLCGLVNMCIMVIRTTFMSKKELISRYRALLTKEGNDIDDAGFDVPDLVIIIFNLLSALAISTLIGSEFGNILTHGPFIYVLLVFLGFFGCFTFFLNFFKKFRTLRFSFFIYSIFYVVSFLGYYGSAKMWLSSEKATSNKVFGLYKSLHISPEIDEMIFAEKILKLNVFDTKKNKTKVAAEDNNSN